MKIRRFGHHLNAKTQKYTVTNFFSYRVVLNYIGKLCLEIRNISPQKIERSNVTYIRQVLKKRKAENTSLWCTCQLEPFLDPTVTSTVTVARRAENENGERVDDRGN